MSPIVLLAVAAPLRILTLAQALETAAKQQPQLVQAHATSVLARAEADEARGVLLPQLNGSATYMRTTSNYVPLPGTVPPEFAVPTSPTSSNTVNFFNFNVTASQLIYDCGVAWGHMRAAQAAIRGQDASERSIAQQVANQVRITYFAARAQRELIAVAREALASQERHVAQVEGFLRVGSHSLVDLYQVRADRANAQVQVITTENAYEGAKAQLNLAMGVVGPTDYDVSDETLPQIPGEDDALETQVSVALGNRPDLASITHAVRAQELTLQAQKGAFGPALNASTTVTEAGYQIDDLRWNWWAAATLSWALFDGLRVYAKVREHRAALVRLRAQLEAARQQVRLDVEQAQLAVHAAKLVLAATAEALLNARERARLAERSYAAGSGTMIEMGDAQLALTRTAAQQVQANYSLATARAVFMHAQGR